MLLERLHDHEDRRGDDSRRPQKYAVDLVQTGLASIMTSLLLRSVLRFVCPEAQHRLLAYACP